MEIVFEGVRGFEAGLRELTVRADVASRDATRFVAAALIRQAKVNASGPPRLAGKERRTRFGTTLAHRDGGPGVVTGRLRNSIVVTSQGRYGLHGWQVTVAPTVIYSRRLELGFNGTDSIGRRYQQPPYPYFTPAYRFTLTVVAPAAYRRAYAVALRL